MFGYRDCVVEPASGAEVGAEPAEMQIEGGGEAGGLAGAHLEGACAEDGGDAGSLAGKQAPQLAANLAAALRPKVRVRMDLA